MCLKRGCVGEGRGDWGGLLRLLELALLVGKKQWEFWSDRQTDRQTDWGKTVFEAALQEQQKTLRLDCVVTERVQRRRWRLAPLLEGLQR